MYEGLSAADIMAITKEGGGNGSGSYGNGAWDNPFIYLVWLALLGNGGLWGNRGGGFGGSGSGLPTAHESVATASDLFEGFNNQDMNGQLRGITQGLCDGFYTMNTGMLNGFNSINAGISNLGYQVSQGFCGVDKGLMNSDFHTQSGFNALGAQLAQCCCENREAIGQVRYDMATQACDTRNLIQSTTRDLIDNQNNNTRAILDFLTQDKISSLQSENQALKFQASQAAQNAFITANQTAQTAELIRRLGRDCPVPAYVVPNPNCCYNYGVYAGNECGCGC